MKLLCAVISAVALVIAGFFANEARKEVYFLCSNFLVGTGYSNVIQQLDTANLSNYTVETTDNKKQITFSSPFNFHIVKHPRV